MEAMKKYLEGKGFASEDGTIYKKTVLVKSPKLITFNGYKMPQPDVELNVSIELKTGTMWDEAQEEQPLYGFGIVIDGVDLGDSYFPTVEDGIEFLEKQLWMKNERS